MLRHIVFQWDIFSSSKHFLAKIFLIVYICNSLKNIRQKSPWGVSFVFLHKIITYGKLFIRKRILAKIILILLAAIVVVIFVFSYVLGVFRRLIFGKIMHPPQQARKPSDDVLYDKDGVTALRGEWKPEQNKR